jgi:hypothetical protein
MLANSLLVENMMIRATYGKRLGTAEKGIRYKYRAGGERWGDK